MDYAGDPIYYESVALILEAFLDKSCQIKDVFHPYASATTCEDSMERSIEYSIELTCVVRFRMLAHLI